MRWTPPCPHRPRPIPTDPASVGCRFKPPPNEVLTESGLTVMKIQLPTGVEPYLDDLRQVKLFPPHVDRQTGRTQVPSPSRFKVLFSSSETSASPSSPTTSFRETRWSSRWTR